MSTKSKKGATRPFTPRQPEPLETWLPRQKLGTPKPNWKAIAASAIGASAYYQLRHYEVYLPPSFQVDNQIVYPAWKLKKHGTMTGLSRAEFVIAINILRQTLAQADYRTILSILGGEAVRNAVLLQLPHECSGKVRHMMQEAANFDARRNFSRFGSNHEEVFYYGL